MPTSMEHCPCGSRRQYAECCGQYIDNPQHPAPTAEALMRSRYTSYALNKHKYLLASWHPSTRPSSLELDNTTTNDWKKLNILNTEQGLSEDDHGYVTFIASYQRDKHLEYLCEKSYFEKMNHQWYYLKGELFTPSKNGVCPCGSKKKFKRCCGKQIAPNHSKPSN